MSGAPMFTPEARAEEPAKIGAIGRIIGVLISPGETFADIARKPSFLAPLILMMVMGLAFSWVMNQRIDWAAFQRQQMEQSPQAANMSADQMNQQARMAAQIAPYFVYAAGFLGTPIMALVMTLVYWGAFNLLGGAGARFTQAIGATTHALCVGLVSGPLTMVVMYMKEYGTVTPENMLASHAGAFLAEDAPKWLVSLASSFELFWFWTIFLLAIGFTAINPKKLTLGKSLGIIIGVWLVVVLLKTGGTYVMTGGK